MAPFHTIVSAIDFSDTSLAAARTAAEMARESGGRLHLLHVVPNVFESPWIVGPHGIAFTQLQRELLDHARAKLTALAATEPFRTVPSTSIVDTGSAPEAIAHYAAEIDADLIVLGTHGFGPMKRFLLGHVADRVIRHARCPVLTLPPETLSQSEPEHAEDRTAVPVGVTHGWTT
jgi:nucleotide-binding universal stress UspA family protein